MKCDRDKLTGMVLRGVSMDGSVAVGGVKPGSLPKSPGWNRGRAFFGGDDASGRRLSGRSAVDVVDHSPQVRHLVFEQQRVRTQVKVFVLEAVGPGLGSRARKGQLNVLQLPGGDTVRPFPG